MWRKYQKTGRHLKWFLSNCIVNCYPYLSFFRKERFKRTKWTEMLEHEDEFMKKRTVLKSGGRDCIIEIIIQDSKIRSQFRASWQNIFLFYNLFYDTVFCSFYAFLFFYLHFVSLCFLYLFFFSFFPKKNIVKTKYNLKKIYEYYF